MRGKGFLGSRNKTVFLAVAVLVVAFFVWTQNLVDNAVLVFLAAIALLVVALAGQVHGGGESGMGGHGGESELEGLHEHPESFEEEVRHIPAGH